MGGVGKKSTILETRKVSMTTLDLTDAGISAKNSAIQVRIINNQREESFWPHINPRKKEAGRTRRDA
jgi:hypothetical protein